MNTKNIMNLVGEFTWFWSDIFFIETKIGNFIWSDPDYGGDNTIKPYDGSCSEFANSPDSGYSEYGRDKGKHLIKNYCPGAKLIEEID